MLPRNSRRSAVQLGAGSGSRASLSDRTMNTRVVALDDAAVLDKVAALPVREWSYTKVGEDDRHITTIDEEGVALAAMQNARTQRENRALRAQLATVERQPAALTATVESLPKR